MPLAARVRHARLLLAAARFSGEISVQPMVDPGISDVEDSNGGGIDGRWWLMSENWRLEASVADENRALFSARWGGKNAENGRGFAL
jgi:protein gp37